MWIFTCDYDAVSAPLAVQIYIQEVKQQPGGFRGPENEQDEDTKMFKGWTK